MSKRFVREALLIVTSMLASSAMVTADTPKAQPSAAPATAQTASVTLPSDAELEARAKKSGVQLTTRGIVLPKTSLKEVPNGPVQSVLRLSEAEKTLPAGKAEKPATTRGGGGYAYIFIKPQNVMHLGHIGWGYWAPNMKYYVGGSTENYNAHLYIQPGHNNGWWSGAYWTEADMFKRFKQLGYYAYKRKYVSSTKPDTAWGRVIHTRDSGFKGIGWNCLDHTYTILEGYGVTGMPWKQTNPAPNGWFNAFPGTAYALP